MVEQEAVRAWALASPLSPGRWWVAGHIGLHGGGSVVSFFILIFHPKLKFNFSQRSALPLTETELKLIAAPQ